MEKNATRSLRRTATSRESERREQAEIRRPDRLTGAQDHAAEREVLAREAPVLAVLLARRHDDPVALDAHDLLDHDGVGARRHDRPGHDAHALARSRPSPSNLRPA